MSEENQSQISQQNFTPSRFKIWLKMQHVVPPNVAVVISDMNGKVEYSARDKQVVQVTEEVKDEKTGRMVPRVVMVKDPDTGDEHPLYVTKPRKPNAVYPKWMNFQQAIFVPLWNTPVTAENIKLNDKDMAEFQCDVKCFVTVIDPVVAAEKTTISQGRGQGKGADATLSDLRIEIHEDFKAIIESVVRTAATQQTILELFHDRKKFQQAVERDVRDLFPKWGLQLVTLEIPLIKDVDGSHIIDNIQKLIDAKIAADAAVKIAQEDKRARLERASQNQEATIREAEAAEASGKRQIERDQVLGIAKQEQEKQVQLKTLETNSQTVEAKRKLDTGIADINRQVTVTNAEAAKQKTILEAEAARQRLILEAEATKQQYELLGAGEGTKARLIGEGQAAQTKAVGEADGAAIRARKVGDAEGTKALAEAQQLYGEAAGEAALEAKKIDAMKEVLIARANAGGKMAENARINVITGDTEAVMSGGILGKIGLGAKEGVSISQFAQMLELTPGDMAEIASKAGNPMDMAKSLKAALLRSDSKGAKTPEKSASTG